MPKGNPYRGIKKLVDQGVIKKLSDLFEHVDQSRVATDLGKNRSRDYVFSESAEFLTFRDMKRLSELTKVDISIVLMWIEKQLHFNQGELEQKRKQ